MLAKSIAYWWILALTSVYIPAYDFIKTNWPDSQLVYFSLAPISSHFLPYLPSVIIGSFMNRICLLACFYKQATFSCALQYYISGAQEVRLLYYFHTNPGHRNRAEKRGKYKQDYVNMNLGNRNDKIWYPASRNR